MNKLEVRGIWNIANGKAKQKFAKLTRDALQFTDGKQQELTGRILKRSGEAQKDLQKNH
jgi:uncharacterized protein YjbJ (UPF0337 family)